MITRTLGTSGLDVSAIGFGCMGLSRAYGLDVPEPDGIAVIRAAPSTSASPSSTPPRSTAPSSTRSSSAKPSLRSGIRS